ncbi:hypothetical protein QBC35DRAFT_482779 [Podospora australis]|uniref:Uncharacterized protein n=1 Tax=Podospora australis TaxID=1536484 RepID=A0AAN6X4J3_9PEZI|nr:hypothetical protein QBC35DRAFT_482779 [Podospora australis]
MVRMPCGQARFHDMLSARGFFHLLISFWVRPVLSVPSLPCRLVLILGRCASSHQADHGDDARASRETAIVSAMETGGGGVCHPPGSRVAQRVNQAVGGDSSLQQQISRLGWRSQGMP